jgi:hypothetical protein
LDDKGQPKSRGDKICCLFPIIGIVTIIIIFLILINQNPLRIPPYENNIELISAKQNLNYTEVINMDLEQIELDLSERGYNATINPEYYPHVNFTTGFIASIYSNNKTSSGLDIMIYASQDPYQIAELDISYRHPGKEDDLEYYKNDIKEKVTEVCTIANVSVNVDQLKFVVSYDCL